jgi:hypothetical protein
MEAGRVTKLQPRIVRIKMKDITSRLTAWIVLLFAVCLLPIGAQAAKNHGAGVVGRVDEQGMSGFWTVTVFSNSGNVIADPQVERNGFFAVELPPGNYVLRAFFAPNPVPGQPFPNFVLTGPSVPVTVLRNRVTVVVLPIALRVPLAAKAG